MSRVFRSKVIVWRSFCSKIDNCIGREECNGVETRIREGKAEILSTGDAFYNPVQEFNRDLSIAVIKEFFREFTPKNLLKLPENTKVADGNIHGKINILEALAATGLRAVRYAKEIPGVRMVMANDYSEKAVENIKRNVRLNGVNDQVVTSCEDASWLMYKHRSLHTVNQFHAVDLDPYGGPTSLLDAAVQCVSDNGLLLVTCTDMMSLCGFHRGSCHAKYGSLSLRISSCHEMALRIVLRSIELHANRYGRHIMPLLSVSVDFYVRIFVRIVKSRSNANKSIEKLAMVYKCVGCETFYLQHLSETLNEEGVPVLSQPPPSLCTHCGRQFQLGGPIWTGNIHDKDFVGKILKTLQSEPDSYNTSKRMIGILSVIQEELENCPLYYCLSKLFSFGHKSLPTMFKVRSALLNAGYQVSLSHARSDSLKTNAPSQVVWDVVRSWVKLHPSSRDITGTPGGTILEKDIETSINFESHPDAEARSRSLKLLRFQHNPKSYWGPKAKVKKQ